MVRPKQTRIAKISERVDCATTDHVYVTAVTGITTIWPAARHRSFTSKT
jgi:hypothetical protein